MYIYVLLFVNTAPDLELSAHCTYPHIDIWYPHSHISRESVQTDTHRPYQQTSYNNPSLHMHMRELMNHNSLSCVEYVHGNLEYMNPWYQRYIVHVCMLYCTDET